MRIRGKFIGLAVACLLQAGAGLFAQGITNYLNFESPQVKPMLVAGIDQFEYLLVCNTPDNSVEIYDISGPRVTFLHRVPVGLEPVSIAWHAGSQTFYTCNWLGDSLTRVVLSVGSTAASLSYIMAGTVQVGDEPTHAVIGDDELWVSLGTTSRIAICSLDLTAISLLDVRGPNPSASEEQAPKHLRRLMSAGGLIYGLDQLGGGLDLAAYKFNQTPVSVIPTPGLGSANFNMTEANEDIYIVSQEAETGPDFPSLTGTANGENVVAATPFGFTRSVLYRLQSPAPGQPVTGTVNVERRNLNEAFNPTSQTVAKSDRVAQPYDVVASQSETGEWRLYIASFGTDRVIVVTNLYDNLGNALTPDQWILSTIDTPPSPQTGNPIAGPRALAVQQSGSLFRVFILNKLDNSLGVILRNNTYRVVKLKNDPTPEYIRHGREFLYNAKLSAANMVSCASCHIDGRLDNLRWDLGAPLSATPFTIPVNLIDLSFTPPSPDWRNDKGPIVTQSLQGLANWEAELDRANGKLTQESFSNAPYHWRADRADFRDFLGAFDSLLGVDPDFPNMTFPNPVSVEDMELFEQFVNSITYPPNFEQPRSREYSGSSGDPNIFNAGSGAKNGLKNFHIFADADGTCVRCHVLPEGSNNLITLRSVAAGPNQTVDHGAGGEASVVVEVAAMRGLRQKETEHVLSAGSTTWDPFPAFTTEVGGVGVLKSGQDATLDGFIAFFFSQLGNLSGPNPPDILAPNLRLMGMRDLVREFDTGTAPMVGFSQTLTPANGLSATTEVKEMVGQAQIGNSEVAVHLWASGVLPRIFLRSERRRGRVSRTNHGRGRRSALRLRWCGRAYGPDDPGP